MPKELIIGKVRGLNTDKVDVGAGMQELAECGYDDERTKMVVTYALLRWARGEEHEAERGAIDQHFHGISLTCWRRVLAAAMAAAESNGLRRDDRPPCNPIATQCPRCRNVLAECDHGS